jgi:nitrate reductase NapD
MPDLHIASCVARVRAESLVEASAAIESIIGGPVSATHPAGKLVILLEGPSTGALLDQMDRIRALGGVLNVEMVYQHSEDESAMREYV